MIGLNHILLFIACISPLVMLAQTFRSGGLHRPWRLASIAVLLVTGVAWLVNPDTAGFVGAGAWMALLFLPAIGMRKVLELASQQRYASARRLSRPLRFLHPSTVLRSQGELLRALELAQAGDLSSALALLEPLRNSGTNVGRQAIAQWFRLRGEWNDLVDWIRSDVPAATRRNDFALMPLYLRALGECGMRDELVLEFGTMLATTSPSQQPAASYHASMRTVLAFCGRLAPRGDHSGLPTLPEDWRQFWLGTDELAAGKSEAGRARLEKLQSATSDRLLRSEIGQRLDASDLIATSPLSPPGLALLDRIEQTDRPVGGAFGSEKRPTVAVLIFIALNLAMFFVEVKTGGSMNPLTLHRLGAMEPWAIRLGGEYWRMLTALFLHFGPLHLIFNLYALFVIGPGLERIIGSVRFAVLYLLTGLGSSAGVLILKWSESRPEQLVGASGCVMGIVGVWAGYLLRHRHEPFAARRLKNIAVIVAIQIAFDLSTPQISMAAHLSGLVTGVLLGLLIGPRRAR